MIALYTPYEGTSTWLPVSMSATDPRYNTIATNVCVCDETFQATTLNNPPAKTRRLCPPPLDLRRRRRTTFARVRTPSSHKAPPAGAGRMLIRHVR